jgi:rhodanese-related sulfurtransferase
MTRRLTPLKPDDLSQRLGAGRAVLIDIRESDEFARAHVPGAVSRPLSVFNPVDLAAAPGLEVVFTCRSGMRTATNDERLAGAMLCEAFVLEGGLDAWIRAGLPVAEDRRAPLDMMRQVQIAAGLLVLTGVSLGLAVHPGFLTLAALVGAGLTFAGVSGFCGMARALALAPWNRATGR